MPICCARFEIMSGICFLFALFLFFFFFFFCWYGTRAREPYFTACSGQWFLSTLSFPWAYRLIKLCSADHRYIFDFFFFFSAYWSRSLLWTVFGFPGTSAALRSTTLFVLAAAAGTTRGLFFVCLFFFVFLFFLVIWFGTAISIFHMACFATNFYVCTLSCCVALLSSSDYGTNVFSDWKQVQVFPYRWWGQVAV